MYDNNIESLLYVQENGKMGGYKPELLKETLEPSFASFVTCSRCEGIMRDASGVGSPQVFMCSVCVEGRSHSALGPNREAVGNLIIWCPLKSRGCEWEGHISSSETHLDTCQYFHIECHMSCGTVVRRIDLESHMSGECPFREIMCEHCTQSLKQTDMNLHLRECVLFPIHCTNGCGDILKRRDLQSHREEMCPNSLLVCGYEKYGCGVKPMRKDLDTHTTDYRLQHMEMRLKFIEAKIESQKRNYSLRTELKLLNNNIKSAQTLLDDLSKNNQYLLKEFYELTDAKRELEHQFTSKYYCYTMSSTFLSGISFTINSISGLNISCKNRLIKVCHKPDPSFSKIKIIEIFCSLVYTSLQLVCVLTSNRSTEYKLNTCVHLINQKQQTVFLVYKNTFVIVDKRQRTSGRYNSVGDPSKHTLVLAEIPVRLISREDVCVDDSILFQLTYNSELY